MTLLQPLLTLFGRPSKLAVLSRPPHFPSACRFHLHAVLKGGMEKAKGLRTLRDRAEPGQREEMVEREEMAYLGR